MKTVVVSPSGVWLPAMPRRLRLAHSISQSLYSAPYEAVLSKPRIHIGLSQQQEPFPNKVPTTATRPPCEMACLTKAIFRRPGPGHDDQPRPLHSKLRHVRHGLPLRRDPLPRPIPAARRRPTSATSARPGSGRGKALPAWRCAKSGPAFDEPNRVLDRETDEYGLPGLPGESGKRPRPRILLTP